MGKPRKIHDHAGELIGWRQLRHGQNHRAPHCDRCARDEAYQPNPNEPEPQDEELIFAPPDGEEAEA